MTLVLTSPSPFGEGERGGEVRNRSYLFGRLQVLEDLVRTLPPGGRM
jgi:hypothetical protein